MRIACVLAFLLAVVVLGCREPKASANVSPETLVRQGALVLDVRSSREYNANHLRGTTNVPIDELAERISKVAPDKNAPLLVHCQSGGRSSAASQQLRSMGYKQVVDLGSLANARKVVEGQ